MDQSIGIGWSCGVVAVNLVEGVDMTLFELGARSGPFPQLFGSLSCCSL